MQNQTVNSTAANLVYVMELTLHSHSEQWEYTTTYQGTQFLVTIIRNLFDDLADAGYDWIVVPYSDDSVLRQRQSSESLPSLDAALAEVEQCVRELTESSDQG